MKIYYHLYELKFKSFKQSRQLRQGALLKIHFDQDLIGFADCHPWEELSDVPLKMQLNLLKQNQLTSLTYNSLKFAKIDAIARSKQISLLSSLKIPPSNYLIIDLNNKNIKEEVTNASLQGFNTFKIKLTGDLKEFHLLKEIFKNKLLRLDFNLKLNTDHHKEVIKLITNLQLNIQYIEDPFLFEAKKWGEMQQKGMMLAADLERMKAMHDVVSAKYVIMKPAVVDEIPVTSQQVIVTSYMDHPFGQCAASFIAAKYSNETVGLLTHHLYEENAFSEQLTKSGPYFKVPEGFGFGFDTLLHALSWIKL